MEKELKELTEQLNEKIKAFEKVMEDAQKAIEGKASGDEIAEMKTTSEAIAEDIQKLSKQQDELEIKLKEQSTPLVKGYGNEFLKALKKADPKEIMKAGNEFAGEMQGHPWDMFKQGTIVIDDNLGAFDLDTAVILPMRTPGVDKAPDRKTSILDLMTIGTTSSNHVTWIERTARTDGTAAVAEAGQYGQSDFHWAQKKALVEKIGTYIKISNESLEDWPFVISEIRNELIGMLRRQLEAEVFSGSGATPHLVGLDTVAVAYSDTDLDDYVTAPTTADAVRAAINQILGDNFTQVTGIILHPSDVAKMQLDKDGNNNYLFPTFFTQDGMRIHGVPVVESTLIGSGYVMVGDFSKVTVYFRRNMDIRIWDQDSTDPEYDLKTITGSLRATIKFPTTAYAGVVYDAISDITSAIAKP